jgi:hypothetical protein
MRRFINCTLHHPLPNAIRVSLENLKGRKYSEDLEVDGRVILEWILGK